MSWFDKRGSDESILNCLSLSTLWLSYFWVLIDDEKNLRIKRIDVKSSVFNVTYQGLIYDNATDWLLSARPGITTTNKLYSILIINNFKCFAEKKNEKTHRTRKLHTPPKCSSLLFYTAEKLRIGLILASFVSAARVNWSKKLVQFEAFCSNVSWSLAKETFAREQNLFIGILKVRKLNLIFTVSLVAKIFYRLVVYGWSQIQR